MFSIEKIRRDWFTDVRSNVLSGIVVALALIPEAIGFSIIAGVDPRVGLFASVIIAIVISFAGGRPAMISAATAATAVLFGTLVRDHGLQYLLAATIVRRQGFWDHRRRELTEALVHQVCHIRPLHLDEASGAV